MENTRKPRGRQRIKLKFIEDKKKREVIFAQRRKRIYKKASELCILTGIDIAILITTLSGTKFAFTHPNYEHVKTQFWQQIILEKSILEPYKARYIEERVQELDEVCENIKHEKKRATTLIEMKDRRIKHVWETSLNDLSSDDARKVKEELRELQGRIISIQNDQLRLLHNLK